MFNGSTCKYNGIFLAPCFTPLTSSVQISLVVFVQYCYKQSHTQKRKVQNLLSESIFMAVFCVHMHASERVSVSSQTISISLRVTWHLFTSRVNGAPELHQSTIQQKHKSIASPIYCLFPALLNSVILMQQSWSLCTPGCVLSFLTEIIFRSITLTMLSHLSNIKLLQRGNLLYGGVEFLFYQMFVSGAAFSVYKTASVTLLPLQLPLPLFFLLALFGFDWIFHTPVEFTHTADDHQMVYILISLELKHLLLTCSGGSIRVLKLPLN